MSLRDLASSDVQSIMNAELGDNLTLTDTNGVEYEVKGWVRRVDMQVDPDTGVKFFEPTAPITISLEDLSEEPTEEWSISTTDGRGNILAGQVRSPMFDRYMNFVTFQIEAVN